MELDLNQAYHGVYCSSKEILNNNQRHLFCNMLDLLARTCKTTGITGSNLVTNDHVKFWLTDILPLVFDDDLSIQSCAIKALSYGVKSLDVNSVQKSDNWPQVKELIVNSFAPNINKLRESRNSNWFRVWCILISVLDKEILKGSSTINSFLSIVELGFRSLDYTVRCEAFLCWRHLIELFSKHDEISSAKRIKLICIPLKSSQPKTSNVAEIKLRVWWYLICKLQNIEIHFTSIIEPFLVFCFGSTSRNVPNSAKMYDALREMALMCLASLVSESENEFIKQYLAQLELDHLPLHFMTPSLFEKHWHTITYSVIEAIKLTETNSERNQIILQILTQGIFNFVMQLDKPYLYEYLFEEITKLLPYQDKPAVHILNIIATVKIKIDRTSEDSTKFSRVLTAYTKFFIANKPNVPRVILQKCINNTYNIQCSDDQNCDWTQIKIVFNIILETNHDEDFNSFETKLIIWNCVSNYLVEYKQKFSMHYRIKERSEVLNSWIEWPLKIYCGFEGKLSPSCFELKFCAVWKQLLTCGQNSPERESFLVNLANILIDILATKESIHHFSDLFDAFALTLLKLKFDTSTFHQIKLFELFKILFSKNSPSLNAYLNTFKNIIDTLSLNELNLLIEEIKIVLGLLLKPDIQKHLSKPLFDDVKRILLEKNKCNPNKTFMTQLKELFQSGDVFVLIPSIWSLNPDKLTDRQKEKYAERAVIPALYNDMSQSQESFMKPWTPKKIVLVNEAQKEIIYESAINDSCNVTNSENSKSLHTGFKKDVENRKPTNDVEAKLNDKKSLKPLTKEDEDLLRKFNVDITDDRKRRSILNNLRLLNIDIVDGESYRMGKSGRPKRHLSSGPNEVKEQDGQAANDVLATEKHDVKRNPNCDNYLTFSPTRQLKTIETPPTAGSHLKDDECVKELISSETDLDELNLHSKRAASYFKSKEESDEKSTETIRNDRSNEKEDNVCPVDFLDTSLNVSNGQPEEKVQSDKSCTVGSAIAMHSCITDKSCENSYIKSLEKTSLLYSPPERKITNNSSSPNIKPKPSSHLTGRGAQLINMIRNKRCETSSNLMQPFLSAKTFDTESCEQNNRIYIENTPARDSCISSSTENTLTPNESRDLLIFSKRLPSPTASPSASILKRKFRRDSFEDITVDSPALKRKRVSFHDPPVSLTKEYIADDDKSKARLQRCLILDKNGGLKNSSVKRLLIRNCKIDDSCDMDKSVKENMKKSPSSLPSSSQSRNGDNYECPLGHENTIKENPCEIMPLQPANDLSFDNHAALLKYLTTNLTFDTILETYSTTDCPLTLKSSNLILKILSNNMKSNSKLKKRVMETLSENHSDEFLDHALQENLTSVICERLNLKSVIDFICSKLKINSVCRSVILSQIVEIFEQTSPEDEYLTFIRNLLSSTNLTDANIFDLIQVLINKRI